MKNYLLFAAFMIFLAGIANAQSPAPVSLTTQAGDGQIELTWSKVSGATGYEITRDGQTIEQIHDPNDTTFADRGPVAGSVHFYCVRSMDGSTPSPYINCVYDSSATNTFIASDSTSDGFIQLSWSLPSACLEAAGDEDIYMEIWDSTADEEFHNVIFDTSALPKGQDTARHVLLQNGDTIDLLNGPDATAPNLVNRLGYSVAVDGNRAIVGSTTQDNGIGAAYIYEYDGTDWVEQAKLSPSDGKVGDRFGYQVAIHHDHAVASSQTDTGKAYVFRFDGTSWDEEAVLMANFPDMIDDFGSALAVKGDQIYVGAPGKYFDLGVVYAFKRNGGNWSQYNMLAASTLQFGQRFGESLSIEGDYAFIGAPEDGTTGRVFVMKTQGAGWSHEANIAPGVLQSGDQFGAAVSVYGTEAAVGAPQRNSATGEVFFYDLVGSNWQSNGTVTPGSASPGDVFGSILSINSGWLAAGVPAHNSSTGKVYLYEKLGGTWVLDQELENTTLLPDAEFGQGVAINSGGQLLVGSPGDDNDRGSLFAYENNGSWTAQQHIQSGNVNPMTTELWVYVLDRSSTNPIFADDNTALRLNTTTDHRLNVKYPGIAPKYIDYVVPLQTWTHLAYTVDAANNATKVYANGRLIAELPEALPIGRERIGSFQGEVLNARVNNIRLWDDVRTAMEIEDNYKAQIDASAAGLIEAWRVMGPPPTLETASGAAVVADITNGGVEEEYLPHLFTDEIKHWVGPDEQRRYSLTFHTYGPGMPLCSKLSDDGATAPFDDPVVTSNSNLPDTVVLNWTSTSDAVSFFRIYRGETYRGALDSTKTQFKDGFALGDPNSLENGITYDYCIEPFSSRFDTAYDTTCVKGSTYDIDLQATDNAHPDKIVLTWNTLETWANGLEIVRDGEPLVMLDSHKTTFTDDDPIPGRDHGYVLRMYRDGNINVTHSDTGSVNAIGVLAGNVLTDDGGFHNTGVVIRATATVLGDTLEYFDTTGIAGDFRIENVFYNTGAEYTIEAMDDELTFDSSPQTRTLDNDQSKAEDIYFFSSGVRNEVAVDDLITSFEATEDTGQDRIILSWDYNWNDTTWFVLYRDNDIIAVLTDTNSSKITSYVDADITPGDTHSYELAGYYELNDTTYSQDSTANGSVPELTPVDSLIATADTAEGNVSLQWNHTSTNITGFYLYRNGALMDSVAIDSAFAFVDWDGIPGQTTTYGIRAFLKKDGSVYTSTMTTASPLTYPMLAAPYDVVATPGTDLMEITWKYPQPANANFDGFLVVRNGGGRSDTIAMVYYDYTTTTTSSERSYSFTDYKGVPDEDYTYQVISYKAAPRYLSSAASDNTTFPDVAVPTSFTASAGSISGTNMLSWTHDSDNFDGFRIRVGTSLYYWVDMDERSFIHTILTSSSPSPQDYQLQAYREAFGTKYFSNHLAESATPPAEPDNGLQEPKKFVASDIYPNQVQLKWEYPPYIFAKFLIFRNGQKIDSVDFNTRFYYDTDVEPDSPYVYQVQAEHPNGDLSEKATDRGSLKSIVAVSGMALGHDSIGIPEVRITVRKGSKLLAKTYTDSSGYYNISGLPDDRGATYDVEAEKINTDFKQPLQQIAIDSQRFYEANFYDKDYWNPYSDPDPDSVATPVFAMARADSFEHRVHIQWLVNNDNYDGFSILKGFEEIATVEKGEMLKVIDEEVEGGYTYTYMIMAFWETPAGTQQSELVPVSVFVPELSPVEGYEAVVNAFRDEVQLYWSHPTNEVTYYEIQRNGTVVTVIDPDETLSYIDSAGLPERLYNYKITAVRIGNTGEIRSPSETRQVTFPSVAPVTELTAVPEPDSNYVQLSWAHTSPHYSYAYIYRNGNVIDTLEKADAKVYNDTRGRTDTLTEWAVSAVTVKDDVRYESDTTTVEAIYPPLDTPRIANVQKPANTLQFDINYPATYGYSGFKIYRNDSLYAAVYDSSGSYQFKDSNGEAEEEYTYKIKAIKDFGNAIDSSLAVSYTDDFPVLATPDSLWASDGIYYNYVEVNWTYPDDAADGFIVYRRPPDGGFMPLDTVGSKIHTYVDQHEIDNNVTSPPYFHYAVVALQYQTSGIVLSDTSMTDTGYAQINRLKTTGVLADTTGGSNKFGQSISTDGNRVAMGGDNSKVLIFDKDNVGNFQSDPASYGIEPAPGFGSAQQMGRSVVITEDKLFAGAPGANAINTDNGAIYGFERNSNNWVRTDTIFANNPDTVLAQAVWDDGLELVLYPFFSTYSTYTALDLPPGDYELGENVFIERVDVEITIDETENVISTDYFDLRLYTPGDASSSFLLNRGLGGSPADTIDATLLPNNGLPKISDEPSNSMITGQYQIESGNLIDLNTTGDNAKGNWRIELHYQGGLDASGWDWLDVDFQRLAIQYRYVEPGSNINGGKMGTSIAYNQGKLAGGAPEVNATFPAGSGNDGSVVLFSDASGEFEKVGQSTLNDPFDGRFGTSVDIDNNVMAVGAPAVDGDAGAAYILNINSSNQIEDEEMENIIPISLFGPTEFGYSVAIEGDFVVVGAPGRENDKGSAFLYEKNANNEWQLAGELNYDSPQASARFGESVAMTGQFIAVGAPGYNNGEGRVSLYERQNDGSWGFSRNYTTPDSNSGAEAFGASVSVGGNILAVGAPEKKSQTTQTYWFYWNGNYYPLTYETISETGGGYIFYLDAAPKNVIATDGEFEGKTRVTWDYNGLRENIDKFKIFRDTVYIGDVDANKNIFFDETGVPGTRYVYNVQAVFKAGSESILVGDVGHSKPDGVIDGKVITQNGAVGVEGVFVEATATVEGVQYTLRDTTDLKGRYKIRRVYYSDSANYAVTVSRPGHKFTPDEQTALMNVNQPEAMVDPFLDLTAYAIKGRLVKFNTNCGVDSVRVNVDMLDNDSLIDTRFETADEDGFFTHIYNPYDDRITHYELRPENRRILTEDGTTDTLFYDFVPDTLQVPQIENPDKVRRIDNFEDQIAYPVRIQVANVCEPYMEDWKIQIVSKNGCVNKIRATGGNSFIVDTLPPYEYTFRVIGVGEANEELIPVVDYLKVRPTSLDLSSFYRDNGRDKTDTLFNIPFIFHKTPSIELTGVPVDSFLCSDQSQALLTKEGIEKSISFEVKEEYDGQLCHVNEGYLVLRNEAATETLDTVFYDESKGAFPEYTFTVGSPNLVEPYTKPMIVEYHTEKDGMLKEMIQPVLIEGIAMLPGADIYVKPKWDSAISDIQMPLFNLYDPPGDGSFSYIEEGTSIEKSVNIFFKNDFMIFAGMEQEVEGAGIEVSFDLTQTFTTGYGFSRGYSLEAAVTERIETSDESGGDNTQQDSAFVGDMEDVVVGLGIALKYGVGYQIYLDGCEPKQRQLITTKGDINTTWIYTVDQMRSLMEEFEKKAKMARNQDLRLDGKTYEESAKFYDAMKTNWERILHYHFYSNVPYINMCNYAFSDLPEPYDELAQEHLKSDFCNKVGSYEGDKFIPDDNVQWDNEKLEGYNKMRGYVEETYKNYIEYNQLDSSNLTEFIPDDIGSLYRPEAENITFSGGSSYDKEYSTGVTQHTTVDQYFASSTSAELSVGADVELKMVTIAGAIAAYSGVAQDLLEAKALIKAGIGVDIEFGRNDEKSNTNTFATGYHLSDDDPGDQFSVNIFKGVQKTTTPYFELFGGRSSCPAEPGTIYRDQPQLDTRYPNGQAVNKTVLDAHPDKPVEFPLQIASINPFNEPRWYQLYLVENTNPRGATLQVNGSVLSTNGNQDFLIDANDAVYATLVVNRNDFYYEYDSLQIGLRSLCDPYVNDIVTLNVHFRHPCTEVSIIKPGSNWIVNSDTTDLEIRLRDYDPYNDQLKRIQVVQRRLGQSTWDTIRSLKPRFLQEYFEEFKTVYDVPTFPFVWDVTEEDMPDGEYELMAIAYCGAGGIIESNRVRGTIDRNSFQVFGKPEPDDGVLSIGDEISVTYNKEIDCPYALSDGAWTFRRDSANGTEVGVTAACSGSKLLYELDTMPELEGRTIYAYVDSVQDKNYNMQKEPVEWSFQISNNPIYWSPQKLAVTVERGKSKMAEVTLESQSSVDRAYTLMNDHLWLTYADAAGIIQPNSKSLTLELDAAEKPLGTYHDTIVADITDFTKISLPVEMRVIAPKPDWNVNESDYDGSLSVIANIDVDSTGLSTDTTNVISAWIDGELRGVDHVRSVGNGYHASYLTVHGNAADSGKEIQFRVWLADSGKIYKGHPDDPMDYLPGGLVYGTTPSPRVIRVNTERDEMNYIPLNKGWTWFSLNREMDDMSTNAVLNSLTPNSGDVIMPLDTATSAEYQHAAGGWITSGLDSLEPVDGYMIHLKEADTLWIWGDVPSGKSFALSQGWNLIGNPNTEPVDVNDAFLVSAPIFEASDILRSQSEFAEYQDDSTWQGSLNVLYPHEAYKVWVQTPKGIVFRGGSSDEWKVNPHDHEHGMRIVGVIKVDGNEFKDDQSKVGAFVNGECRGVGELEYIPEMDRFMLTMMVYGDEPQEELEFRIHDGVADTTMEVKETMSFGAGKLKGSYRFPYAFSPEAITGISSLGADGMQPDFEVSPNPFTTELRLTFEDDQARKYVVEIYNGAGELFFKRQLTSAKGDNKWTIRPGQRLASGMYYVTVKFGDAILQTFKVVKE